MIDPNDVRFVIMLNQEARRARRAFVLASIISGLQWLAIIWLVRKAWGCE